MSKKWETLVEKNHIVENPYIEKVRYHERMIQFYKRVWNSTKGKEGYRRLVNKHACKRLLRHYLKWAEYSMSTPFLR